MLPEAAGRGQHFQGRGQSFSLYGKDPKPVNNLFVFLRTKKTVSIFVNTRTKSHESVTVARGQI